MPRVYQSYLSRDCAVRPVDDLFLVFFRPSGQTHMLPVVSMALLDVLDETPLGIAEIPAALAARYETDPEAGAEAVLERLLHELEEVGLVGRVSGENPA